MTAGWRKVLGGENRRRKVIDEIVREVNAVGVHLAEVDDSGLRASTVVLRERLANGEDLDDLLVDAFAIVREAAQRTLGLRPYDEQIAAGAGLHLGWVVEMRTGEGKTLAAAAPIYLNALTGRGVHVITANDYLVRRDAMMMVNLFGWLGMSVGAIHPDVSQHSLKREAYASDITYGTAIEFGFDYLRDNMALTTDAVVQRGFNFALIDEVDSVLIDEARTPLIISGPGEVDRDSLAEVAQLVAGLEAGRHFETDLEHQVVTLTEEGADLVDSHYGIDNVFDLRNVELLHRVTQALRARELYHRDRDYLVRDDAVHIVDEFTGRILEGRRWSDGLHQAVEAKEGVRVLEENARWATVTIQSLFHLYDKVAGMSGTVMTDAEEFGKVYGLAAFEVPTHRPIARADHADVVYRTAREKWDAVVEEIVRRHGTGQPVLAGTTSVADSELLAERLREAGVTVSVLNAKEHAREASIIAQAGRRAAVTVATNMAGRGVDILLGGNAVELALAEANARGMRPGTPEAEAAFEALLNETRATCAREGEEVRAAGGLCVIGTARHESRRVDNQLRGRAGRQGDPGESRFYLSLEDELMEVFDASGVGAAMARVVAPGRPISLRTVLRVVDKAQEAAEARSQKARQDLFTYDESQHAQRLVVYSQRRSALYDGVDEGRLTEAVDGVVDTMVERWGTGFPEEWNLTALHEDLADLVGEAAVSEEIAAHAQDSDDLREELRRLVSERIALALASDSEVGRRSLLEVLDREWRTQLLDLEALREGINWRAVGRFNPLHAWQAESYRLFEIMLERVDRALVRAVAHAAPGAHDQEDQTDE